jgi:UDP-2-acetamido-3-amino-2,3-dideoxy-glucuronate N-acetyltransferase
VKDGEELVALAAKNKKTLMIDHLLHYHPAVIKLKELLGRGEIGDIQYIYSNRLSIGKFRNEENILWSFAPHDVSVILSLVMQEPREVKAFGEAYLQKGIYDTTLTTIVFNEKLKAHIFVNWLHPFKEQKLVVIGTKNMAVFDDQSNDKLVLYPHKVNWVSGMPVASKAAHNVVEIGTEEPLEKACRHFLDCAKTGKTPLTDGEEALRVLRVLNYAEEALERNKDGK